MHTNICFSVLAILINSICLIVKEDLIHEYFISFANVECEFRKKSDLQRDEVCTRRLISSAENILLKLVQLLKFNCYQPKYSCSISIHLFSANF